MQWGLSFRSLVDQPAWRRWTSQVAHGEDMTTFDAIKSSGVNRLANEAAASTDCGAAARMKQGFKAAELQVVELSAEGRARLEAGFGVRVVASIDDASLDCDVLVLAVKPQQLRDAVAPMAGRLASQVVVSIAAGLRLADIGRWLGGYDGLVRAMPNTPALIGAGITGLFANAAVSAVGREAADKVLSAVGSTVWVADEAQIDSVTAVSGSGPAYVFHFIECLQAAGESMGFDGATARKLAIDTVLGAARLAAASDESPAVLRERVKLVVVDYWQLVVGCPRGETEAQHLAGVAQWLADFMRRHDLVGLTAAQINRQGETRGGPLGGGRV